MKNRPEKILLTAEEISHLFGIPLSTIYRLSKKGKLKGLKIGKQWRYLKANIEKLISTGNSPRTLPARIHTDFIERREYPRINCNLKCKYNVNIPSLKEFQSDLGSIRNLSSGGVLIYDKPENIARLTAGDPIELRFELHGQYISINGRIVRIVKEGIGIKFRNIDKRYHDEITRYVG